MFHCMGHSRLALYLRKGEPSGTDGTGLHGTPDPDAIGRDRSHGCIRLSNWAALKPAKSVSPWAPSIVK